MKIELMLCTNGRIQFPGTNCLHLMCKYNLNADCNWFSSRWPLIKIKNELLAWMAQLKENKEMSFYRHMWRCNFLHDHIVTVIACMQMTHMTFELDLMGYKANSRSLSFVHDFIATKRLLNAATQIKHSERRTYKKVVKQRWWQHNSNGTNVNLQRKSRNSSSAGVNLKSKELTQCKISKICISIDEMEYVKSIKSTNSLKKGQFLIWAKIQFANKSSEFMVAGIMFT